METNHTAADRPANATLAEAAFAARPDATLALTYMGHAYHSAAFRSRCRLTGDVINQGEAIRRVTIVTRSGHEYSGIMAARTCAWLRFHGDVTVEAESGNYGVYVTEWQRTHDDWAEIAVTATEGQSLTVQVGRDYDTTEKGWTLCKDGKWRGANYTALSPKQLRASLSRGKRTLAYKVSKAAA